MWLDTILIVMLSIAAAVVVFLLGIDLIDQAIKDNWVAVMVHSIAIATVAMMSKILDVGQVGPVFGALFAIIVQWQRHLHLWQQK